MPFPVVDTLPLTPGGPTPPAPAPKPATPPAAPPKGCAGASGWLVAAVLGAVLLAHHPVGWPPRWWPFPVPTPTPAPAPAPAPKPDGYMGPLWGVLVLPDEPTPAQAALETDPKVRQACEAASVEWRAYRQSASAVKGNAWDDDLAAAGGPPVVLWMKGSGTLAAVTRAPDPAKVVADLRAIRGVK